MQSKPCINPRASIQRHCPDCTLTRQSITIPCAGRDPQGPAQDPQEPQLVPWLRALSKHSVHAARLVQCPTPSARKTSNIQLNLSWPLPGSPHWWQRGDQCLPLQSPGWGGRARRGLSPHSPRTARGASGTPLTALPLPSSEHPHKPKTSAFEFCPTQRNSPRVYGWFESSLFSSSMTFLRSVYAAEHETEDEVSEKLSPIQISFLCVCTRERTGQLCQLTLLFVISSSYAQLTSRAAKRSSSAQTDERGDIYVRTGVCSTYR